MTISTVWCHCLDSWQGTDSFNHHWFCAMSANVNKVKKANVLVVVRKYVWLPEPSWKSHRGSPGFQGPHLETLWSNVCLEFRYLKYFLLN